MSENEMDSFHGKGLPLSFVTYSGTRKLVSKLRLRRMGPRPAARLAALVRGWLSTKSRRYVNKIPEIAENKKKTDGAGKCWYVKQEMFAKYDVDENYVQEWKYILEQPNKKEEEAASRPDHEDRQSRSVQSDYQVCEDSHG